MNKLPNIYEINDKTAEELQDYYKTLRLSQNIPYEERKLLEERFVLEDGRHVHKYSVYLFKNKWLYICHLCNMPGKNWNTFICHINGKAHRELRRCPINTVERFGIRIAEGPKGKVIKPGIVEHKHTIFTKATRNYDEPLIGTEYLVELVEKQPVLDPFSATADYVCLLCDEEGNIDFIKEHLGSFKHCWTYLNKFFPYAVKQIGCKTYDDETMLKVVKHIVAKVEYTYGRLKASQVLRTFYPHEKRDILEKIDKGQHMREVPGKDFGECVDPSKEHIANCPVGWLRRLKEQEKGGKPHLAVPPPLSGPAPMTKRKRLALGRKFREEDRMQINNDIEYNKTYYDTSYLSGNRNWNNATSGSNNSSSESPVVLPQAKPSNLASTDPQRNFNRFNEGRGTSFSNEEINIMPSDSKSKSQGFNPPSEPVTMSCKPLIGIQDTSHSPKEKGIIPVLRTLSIFETKLGSLGLQVIDLLKEAIRLEKTATGGANVLITREEILLETIKEKLFALLELKILDHALVNAAKSAIEKLDSLLPGYKTKYPSTNTGSFESSAQSFSVKSECPVQTSSNRNENSFGYRVNPQEQEFMNDQNLHTRDDSNVNEQSKNIFLQTSSVQSGNFSSFNDSRYTARSERLYEQTSPVHSDNFSSFNDNRYKAQSERSYGQTSPVQSDNFSSFNDNRYKTQSELAYEQSGNSSYYDDSSHSEKRHRSHDQTSSNQRDYSSNYYNRNSQFFQRRSDFQEPSRQSFNTDSRSQRERSRDSDKLFRSHSQGHQKPYDRYHYRK